MKDYYRFILFFVLGWIMFSIISCTTAPIRKEVIRHGVVDYYELVEPLGTKHLYRTEPLIDKTYYLLQHIYSLCFTIYDDFQFNLFQTLR